MRILVLTRYARLGSSSRVRFYQYFPYLQANGAKITCQSFFDNRYIQRLYWGKAYSANSLVAAYVKRLLILGQTKRFDLLWIEKELFPLFPAGFEYLLHGLGVPYVVDYDDAVFHRYEMHNNTMVRSLLRNKIDHVMKNAKIVVAGNQYIADRAIKAGAQNTIILPSVVDVDRYRTNAIGASENIKIGWIGSPVTVPNLDVLREALVRFAIEVSLEFVLIGAGEAKLSPVIKTKNLVWNENDEYLIGREFDVGVMPLIDGPFERGKCGYKLIQYMAAGLPVIASPVGVNSTIVEHGVNGYLATSTHEWLFAFQQLAESAERRAEMGKAGRQKAKSLYDLKVTGPVLLDILSKAL